MTPVKLEYEHFVIAVPHDEEDSWQFFRCQVCHNTKRPGNWFQLGIQVQRTIELEGSQRAAFREHIARIDASAQ